jgi:hypothetical protein
MTDSKLHFCCELSERPFSTPTEQDSHQKTALDFMIQRENGPIPDAYRLWQPDEADGQPWYAMHIKVLIQLLIPHNSHRHKITNTICESRYPRLSTDAQSRQVDLNLLMRLVVVSWPMR